MTLIEEFKLEFQAQFVLDFPYAAGAESAPSHQKHKRFAAAVSSPKTAQRPPKTAPPNPPLGLTTV